MNASAILKMVDAGIHGYVDKSGTDAEFTRAVIFLLEGRAYFSKEALQHVIKGSESGEDLTELIAANTDFTAREVEIIRLICQRKKPREISRRLELPEKTVEQALTDIMHRIGARDKADVIKFAIQQGIIGLNEL